MKIVQTTQLNPQQRQDILNLMCACRKVQPSCPAFPFEDLTSYYLLYAPQLVSALALVLPPSPYADETAECVAFTHPDHRQKNYFTALLQAAEAEIMERDILFLTDGRDTGALKTLERLEAEYDSSEYRMELSLLEVSPLLTNYYPEIYRNNPKISYVTPAATRSLSWRTEQEDGSVRTYYFHLRNDSLPAGKADSDQVPPEPPDVICHISFSGTGACLYGFFVDPLLRGCGLGKEALATVIHELKQEGLTTLFLHVSGDNTPAVNLYKKAGFRTTETLDYYFY